MTLQITIHVHLSPFLIQKINMKQFFLLFITLAASAALFSQEASLDSALFIQKESDAYQCVQVRRGDRIELKGKLSMEKGSEELFFESTGERLYLLRGDLASELRILLTEKSDTPEITLKGTLLFEGLEMRPAELEITAYSFQEEIR